MVRFLCFVSGVVAVSACCGHFAAFGGPPATTPGVSVTSGTPPADSAVPRTVSWESDYLKAMDIAVRERKLLVVHFQAPGPESLYTRLQSRTLRTAEVAGKLRNAVAVRLPLDAKAVVDGSEAELLKHAAFSGLGGGPGLAVVDLATTDPQRYGRVTRTLHFRKWWPVMPRQVAALLDGSPGAPGSPTTQKPDSLVWYDDYNRAIDVASREGRMVLVLFCAPGRCTLRDRFEAETLSDPVIRDKLADMVKVKVPLDGKITVEGKEIEVIKHPSFAEMVGLPGLAIIDYAHKDPKQHGHVVSEFPFLGNRIYTIEEMREILNLPPGTLTQRTLIYAVRTHPERPASTRGQLNPTLAGEAESHSDYQARIRLQGHHAWESRFHRINAQLPDGLTASEVCAESWPGQGLVEAAVECVRCWRLSSGHWSAVQAEHRVYGYDMKRGANGVWYATGIFGRN